MSSAKTSTSAVCPAATCSDAGQHLTREEALRLFTHGNSWFLRLEDKIGTIGKGKFADLVVLDRDYFKVPDEEIKKIRSVLTVVGGTIVHDTGELTGRGH